MVLFSAVPPQISHFSFGEEVINAGEITITQCTVIKGDLPLNISWYFNGKPVQHLHGVAVAKSNQRISSLTIESADETHSGEFSCVAENAAGKTSYSAFLSVNGSYY